MLYEKAEYKALKKKTSRDCMICFGKCSGHKDITEKEPVSILIAEQGIFLERAKGQDAVVKMEQILAFKQMESSIVLKTSDPEAKRLTLSIHSQVNRDKGCRILSKCMPPKPEKN